MWVSEGLRAERVAEIIVHLREGNRRRGSGYLAAPGRVLTAAHVVTGAGDVTVRFNADRPGEHEFETTVSWQHAGIDVAVLTFHTDDCSQSPYVRFGRIGERDAVLTCTAAGFPEFKLRKESASTYYRDLEHISATCAALSNRREGTLDLSTTAPADPREDVSPWPGMSGAAVFANELCVGVVFEHHLADGTGRLAARRVDRWAEQLTEEERHGLEALLWCTLEDLPDALSPSIAEQVDDAYRNQIDLLAPKELLDRAEDIKRLVEFCAGHNPYLWLQGPAWSGKTALAAAFAQHPPRGVVPVCVFITNQSAGQNDSLAYTDRLISQLAAIARWSPSWHPDILVRRREQARLLEEAAGWVAHAGAVLLLVVDGLDEDEHFRALSKHGGESIASLLPAALPENVRVLVTSRPDLPYKPTVGHPLKHCPVHRLEPVPAAKATENKARADLDAALEDELGRELAGLLTAARGGLTPEDLRELVSVRRDSDWHGYQVRQRLRGPLGRILSVSTEHEGYVFAHATLFASAEEQLGQDVRGFQKRLHTWADEYAANGWPDNTPRYLTADYGRMVASLNDYERLARLSRDVRRGVRMRAVTGTDAAALTEIELSRNQIRQHRPDDLVSLAALAAAQYVVGLRNSGLHPSVPIAWARLGERDRAIDLARGIRQPIMRAKVLADIARILADTGHTQRAIGLTHEAVTLANQEGAHRTRIGAEERHVEVVGPARGVLVIPPTLFGQPREEHGISVNIDEERREILRTAAITLTTAGDRDGATVILRTLESGHRAYPEDDRQREKALSAWISAQAAVAVAARDARKLPEGQQAAAALSLEYRIPALATIAEAYRHCQSPSAEAVYDEISRQRPPAWVSKVPVSQPDMQPEMIVGGQPVPVLRHESVKVLAACALALAGVRPQEAATRAREAGREAGKLLQPSIVDDQLQHWQRMYDPSVITAVIQALARTGQWQAAQALLDTAEDRHRDLERLAREDVETGRAFMASVIPPDEMCTYGRYALAHAQLQEGLAELAAQTLMSVWSSLPSSHWRIGPVLEALDTPAAAEAADELLAAARGLGDDCPWPIAEVLVALAGHLPDQAGALVREAEQLLARAGTGAAGASTDQCYADLAAGLATAGRLDEAEQVLYLVDSTLVRALTAWPVLGAARAGNDPQAMADLNPFSRPWLMAAVVESLARAGEHRVTPMLAEGERGVLRDKVYASVVDALWEHAPATAREMVSCWEDRLESTDKVFALAYLLAATGRREPHRTGRRLAELETLAAKPDKGRHHSLLLLGLAALSSNHPRAREWLKEAVAVRQTPAARPQADEVAAFALAQAAAGWFETAMQTAESVTAEENRAEVLALLAGYLAQSAAIPVATRTRFQIADLIPLVRMLAAQVPPADLDTARSHARKIVATVLCGDAWHHALPVLGDLAPAAVITVRDTVFAHLGLRPNLAGAAEPEVLSEVTKAAVFAQLAVTVLADGRSDDAVKLITSSIDIYRQADDRRGEASALAVLSLALTRQPTESREEQAAAAQSRAAQLLREISDSEQQAEAQLELGIMLLAGQQFGKAAQVLRDAVTAARAAGANEIEAIALIRLCDVPTVQQSSEALTLYSQAAEAARASGNRQAEALSLNNLGAKLSEEGRFDEAANVLGRAAKLGRELGDRRIETNSLTSHGEAMLELNRADEAVDVLTAAAAAARKLGDRVVEARATYNLGDALTRVKPPRVDITIETYMRASELYRQLGDTKFQAGALNNLGIFLGGEKRYQEAIDVLNRALAITRAANDPGTAGGVLFNLATQLDSIGRTAEAARTRAESAAAFDRFRRR